VFGKEGDDSGLGKTDGKEEAITNLLGGFSVWLGVHLTAQIDRVEMWAWTEIAERFLV